MRWNFGRCQLDCCEMLRSPQLVSKTASRIATQYRRLVARWDKTGETRSPLVRVAKRILFFAAFAAVVVGLLVAVQKVPEWQVKRASVRSTAVLPEAKTTPADIAALQNEMRKTFVQVVGGVFVVLALYLTYRRTKVTEQGHITDRYTRAIEQLGATKEVKGETKPNVEVRLGAIYALERIALDSPRDHWTIMEVLTAYVRENAPAPRTIPTDEENREAVAKGPATEIQAILTVLGRRRRDRRRERVGQLLDLGKSDLRGASLVKAHMEGANFGRAHVVGGDFSRVHAEGATFVLAYLEGVDLFGAHLEGADFGGAQMKGAKFGGGYLGKARFRGAQLEEANFEDGHLEDANFWGACLRGASFRSGHAVRAIFGDADLEGANFALAQADGVVYSEANVKGADFSWTTARGADFGGAFVQGADFTGANIEGANFLMAHAREAVFWSTRANGVDFAMADVESADFNAASIKRANFGMANVKGANFAGAQVEGATFLPTMGLEVEEIRKAEGWERAHYEERFARALGLVEPDDVAEDESGVAEPEREDSQ